MRGAFAPPSAGAAGPLVRHAEAYCNDANAIAKLHDELASEPLSLVALFVSAEADFAATMAEAARRFTGIRTIGCTTAGELGRAGYVDGRIVAVAFPEAYFLSESVLIEDLDALDTQALIADMIRTRARLTALEPDWTREFGFLLVDGLSLLEDPLAAACADALGPVPLFGGSAGDGISFEQAAVAVDGRIYRNAAVLTYFRTLCGIQVFSHDHLTPSSRRMVVTEADPKKRIVRKINAEPAAREYARILGKDPEQLDPFTFAAHPVVVRFGGTHHVRSIQRVSKEGELVFFSAIEEGLVLTLADPEPMDTHLRRELEALTLNGQPPQSILACDCILRRLEAQEKQVTHQISSILSEHSVIGFSTYGEQIGGMHVNQTLTGVAFYAPDPRPGHG